MESVRKVRSTNFSKEEELLLLQEIAKFQHIIECKTTNKINNKDKVRVLLLYCIGAMWIM